MNSICFSIWICFISQLACAAARGESVMSIFFWNAFVFVQIFLLTELCFFKVVYFQGCSWTSSVGSFDRFLAAFLPYLWTELALWKVCKEAEAQFFALHSLLIPTSLLNHRRTLGVLIYGSALSGRSVLSNKNYSMLLPAIFDHKWLKAADIYFWLCLCDSKSTPSSVSWAPLPGLCPDFPLQSHRCTRVGGK